jgi:predicted transcriptional regulator
VLYFNKNSLARQESSFGELSLDGRLEKLLKIEKEPKIVAKLTDILSILSKTDALTIFSVAKNGLESELDTPQKIGLTKKQYYTRLKQLVELGLLNKNESKYVHTALGNLIYEKHVVGLLNNIKISKELEMIDLLKRTSKFKPEEISNFISKLNPELSIHENLGAGRNHFELTSTYDSMVRKVLELIDLAETEILLASRFQDERIINGILKKTAMGIHTTVISDINLVADYFESEKDKMKINDKNKNERVNVVANPFYPAKIERRYLKVPYCLLIIDGKHVGIEIINNCEPEKFKMALFGIDEKFSTQLKDEFNRMWVSASATPPQVKSIQ